MILFMILIKKYVIITATAVLCVCVIIIPLLFTLSQGRTPLHYSAVNDKVDVCYTLLTKGADATQKDFEGKTPLDYSREQGNEYAVALFTCQENSIADFTRMTRLFSLLAFACIYVEFGSSLCTCFSSLL